MAVLEWVFYNWQYLLIGSIFALGVAAAVKKLFNHYKNKKKK